MNPTTRLPVLTTLLALLLTLTPTILSHPLALRASSVLIDLKTGDGDAATTFMVPLDTLTPFGQAAVAASIDDTSAFCEAFADAAGTTPFGTVFTSVTGLSLSNSSDGSTASSLADAVTVGAFLCSDSMAGLTAADPSGTTPTVSTTTTTSAASPPPPAASTSTSNTGATVRVQLEQSQDTFTQATVPLDGSIFPTASNALGSTGIELSLVSASGANLADCHCQVYMDTHAMVPVGGPATATTDATLSYDMWGGTVAIASIRCVDKST